MGASPTKKWLALLGLGMGVFMATLDASIVNISLPTLVKVFNTSFATVQWVVLSYVVVLASLMLGIARLGDMRDKKLIYLSGLGLFTFSSFLCGLSPSIGWLIGFRALQGLGAVMMQALGNALVTQIVAPSERGRALGLMGTTVSIGIAIGPPLGGLLIGSIGWQSVFWVNVPVGILTALAVWRFVPACPPSNPNQRFDGVGALVLFFTLGAYALGMTLGQEAGFSAPWVRGLLVGALVGLALFILIEKRISQPMLDLSLFRNPFFSINLLMGFLVFVVLAGGFIMPFYLENVKGFSVQMTGLFLMANPILMGITAPIAGSLSDRFGSRVISLIGLILIVAGCISFGSIAIETSVPGILWRMGLMGLGMGMFQSPNNSAIMGAAPRERLGVASGLIGLARTLGSSTGLPLMGSLFTAQVLTSRFYQAGIEVTSAAPQALVDGLRGMYGIAAGIVFLSTLLASLVLWMDTHRKRSAQTLGSIQS